MSISVLNISKRFGNQQALDEVSFEVKKGEIAGFLGPNGAGKSTLMKILTTSYLSDSGTASISGFDVKRHSDLVRKNLGYLPEHNPLNLELYVKEYLSFCSAIHNTSKSRIREVIEMTGLEPEAHKKIGALSKGYRQRVGLAAALLHDPEVLILDEPTTGLDPNQLIEIRKLIREIGSQKTILLSTHIMKEVEAVCDRVLILNRGKLVADSNMADLRASEKQIIVVEFDYRVEDQLFRLIPNLNQHSNIGGFVYELEFITQEDMRPAVFDFARTHELKTLNLNRKSVTLENLFISLTQKNPNPTYD
jgi:ABC-2 type transport system ATP-binding protein